MSKVNSHYENLKVARNAPPEVIRAAYRSLSQKHHPDRNPDNEDAARIMKVINAAYEVLSDPTKRREHDQWIATAEAGESDANQQPPHNSTPHRGQSSTFEETEKRQKSTSSQAAVSKAKHFAAHVSKNWGWYGLGILATMMFLREPSYTPSTPPHGPKPYQAMPANEPRTITDEKNLATKPKAATSEISFEEFAAGERRAESLKTLPAKNTKKFLTDEELFGSAKPSAANDGSLSYDEWKALGASAAPHPQRTAGEKHGRPNAAPNGQPWPISAGYVRGYKLLHANGFSSVTVDNSRNNSDVFVKLVSIGGAQAFPVRQFFIPGYGSFKLNKLAAGSYDIRYRDLSDGGLSRSEAFNLVETPIDNGTQYDNVTMTLYKVKNGNMQTYGLSEAEF